jgi:ribosome-associated translation inhibitor RaiA
MSEHGGRAQAVLGDRLRLGPGFHEADRERVQTELSSLGRHLVHWSPDRVDLQVSVKDRGGPQQTVTLEAWLPGWPSQLAHSTASDLGRALIEVRQEMIRRLEDGKAKRHPH